MFCDTVLSLKKKSILIHRLHAKINGSDLFCVVFKPPTARKWCCNLLPFESSTPCGLGEFFIL